MGRPFLRPFKEGILSAKSAGSFYFVLLALVLVFKKWGLGLTYFNP
jgi:hypothetical protein